LRIGELRTEIQELSEEHKRIIVKNEYDELMTRAGGVWQNASTGWDVTNYFIQLPANQLEFWFQMQADRLLKPVFREFYSERDVVYEERRLRTESTPLGKFEEEFISMFWQSSPYAWPIVGWPSDLPTIEFYPNGGSNGGTILLETEGEKGYRIRVHFLTGMVVIGEV